MTKKNKTESVKRYKVNCNYVDEIKPGMPMTHEIRGESDNIDELTDSLTRFLNEYDPKYCHSLNFHITEVEVDDVS